MQGQGSYLSLLGVKSVCGFPKDRMWSWGGGELMLLNCGVGEDS